MSLKLYFHPLSSFCQKALVALYENDTPFEPLIVDLFDAKSSAALKAIWPIGRFPVLRDEANDRTVCLRTPSSRARCACRIASTISM
jgi:glutathione S-transferase